MKKTVTFSSTLPGALAYLLVLAVIGLGFIGWVLNLVQIADTDHFTGMLILRAIGIFVAPLGAVLGWV